MTRMKITQVSWATAVLPPIVDGIGLVLLFVLAPVLSERLRSPAGLNALLLVTLFLLFLVGVFLLRKLEPATEDDTLPPWLTWLLGRKTRGVLALLFGLGMMTAVSYQLGYFDVFMQAGPAELDEGASSSLFVFGPSAWLFLSMFYIFILAFPVSPSFAVNSGGYFWASAIGLFGGNLLLLLAASQIQALVTQYDLNRWGWALPLLILLLVLFAPPRLLYANQQTGWRSVITFAILLLACVWFVMWGG